VTFRSSVGIWFGCDGPASQRRTMASPGIPKEQRGRHEIATNESEYRVDRGVDGSGILQRRRANDLTVQASIVDGDTLESHETRVRLWGGDAPESSQPCRARSASCIAAAALALPSRQFKRRSREGGSGRPPTFAQIQFASGNFFDARAASAAPGSREPSRAASRPVASIPRAKMLMCRSPEALGPGSRQEAALC
jgi:hypothetical protein